MKKVISILLSIYCFSSQLVFCSTESEFSGVAKQLELIELELSSLQNESDKEKVKMRNTVIKANVHYVEGCILKKRKKAESRLEKYQISLHNSQNGEEVQRWLKKVESAEKKIKNLHEIMLGIELLKSKLLD